jgi:hypothetical protein
MPVIRQSNGLRVGQCEADDQELAGVSRQAGRPWQVRRPQLSGFLRFIKEAKDFIRLATLNRRIS